MATLPITFTPLYKSRVWGGRSLESHYGRHLPDDLPYGESWELVDRPEDQSVVSCGDYAGKTLNELWTLHREGIFGKNLPKSECFPILVKILDCREDLSIQVHPPTALAPSLGGEPKTEMWYLADADADASLYIGLKNGVTKDSFEESIQSGTVAEHVHRIAPKSGESIFIPSGRLHAIGGGNLIFEIQQNSDTTYRVFDWNRLGLDGQPRELHLEESLASIDFSDFEPDMDSPDGRTLASCPFFKTDKVELETGEKIANPTPENFSILGVVSGELKLGSNTYSAGQFLLLPKGATPLRADTAATVLQITLPRVA